jgi:hypothetical protein
MYPQIVYDPESHVKALFAWSSDTIVVSFRGSAAPVNWLMDMLVGRQLAVGGGGGSTAGGSHACRCCRFLPLPHLPVIDHQQPRLQANKTEPLTI